MVTFAAATRTTSTIPPRTPAQRRVDHFVAITCSDPNDSCDSYNADCRSHAQLVSPSRDPISAKTWSGAKFDEEYYPIDYEVYCKMKSALPTSYITGYVDCMNLFQYAMSKPQRFLDPSGLRVVRCCQFNHDGDIGHDKYVWVPDTFTGDPCSILAGAIGDKGTVKECRRPPDVTIAVRMCAGDPTCEKELVQLLDLIPNVWVWGFFTHNPFCKNDGFIACGSRETCKWWQVEFMNVKQNTLPGGAFKCISAQPEDFDYHGSWPGWGYHATIKVCFPSGKCIYLDQGWLGGEDHFFERCDLPATFW